MHEIQWCEVVTSSTGKEYKKATIQGEAISVWPDFSEYANVQAGRSVGGVIQAKGKYKNLVDDRGYHSKPKQGVAGFVERKEAGIERSQVFKADSVMKSATFRDATALTIAEIAEYPDKEISRDDIRKLWLEWRSWLIANWEPTESTDDHGGRYEEDPTRP